MIYLRKTTVNDLDLLKLWDQQDHIKEAGISGEWNWELEFNRSHSWKEQLIAEIDGRPIGFIQIIDPAEEETHYWGDIGPNKRAVDIWIGELEYTAKGYGTKIMELTLDRCFSDLKVDEVFVDPLESNQKAIQFYKKLGFKFREVRGSDEAKCAIYSLSRNSWKSDEYIA